MSPQVNAMQQLAGVRRRRGERLAAALAEARRSLAECEADVASALQKQASFLQAEARARAAFDVLTASSFKPSALLTAGLAIDKAVDATARSGQAIVQCQQAAMQQSASVDAARAAVRLNEQRLERLQASIRMHARDHAAAQDDLADDESEESASVRRAADTRRSALRHG